jgi:hypothetical protein
MDKTSIILRGQEYNRDKAYIAIPFQIVCNALCAPCVLASSQRTPSSRMGANHARELISLETREQRRQDVRSHLLDRAIDDLERAKQQGHHLMDGCQLE